jgi:oligoribonuclease
LSAGASVKTIVKKTTAAKGITMSETPTSPQGTSQQGTPQKDLLVWIDLEMTGLDPNKERIIEVATLVTDSDLNTVAEGPVIAVKQADSLLEQMDDWNQTTHGESGLVKRVQESTTSPAEAEAQTLAFLREYVTPQSSPMCGNSIHQDRRFLEREMPELWAFFHYRNLDVSTLKELAKRWNPDAAKGFNKRNVHLAMDDIKESIGELKHYRRTFLNTGANAEDAYGEEE